MVVVLRVETLPHSRIIDCMLCMGAAQANLVDNSEPVNSSCQRNY